MITQDGSDKRSMDKSSKIFPKFQDSSCSNDVSALLSFPVSPLPVDSKTTVPRQLTPKSHTASRHSGEQASQNQTAEQDTPQTGSTPNHPGSQQTHVNPMLEVA